MSDKDVSVRLSVVDDATGPLRSAASAASQLSKSLKAVDAKAVTSAGSAAKGMAGPMDKAATATTGMSRAAQRLEASAVKAANSGSNLARVYYSASQRMQAASTGFATAGAKIEKASKAADEAKSNMEGLTRVSGGLTKAGLAAGAAFGVAVARFATFDKQMARVAAGTGAAGDELSKLRQTAVQLGNGDLGFNATAAAQGITELGKAGVSTADIMGGGLRGTLALAASGELEVGDAAETAASAMTQFGLKGKDIGHIADLLSAGAAKAQGSVGDLGMALNQVGLVANGVGANIDETVGTLAAFASAGLTGSDAGTSFKTMLQRLTPQSEEAQKQFNQLGISAYDAQGNFVGLAAFAGQLQGAMKDMTPEARNSALAVMFGSDAVRAANVLYKQGAQGVTDWTAKVADSGHAARTAATLMDNLQGDVSKLSAAFDSAFIQGGSGANDALRGMIKNATGAVQTIGSLPEPVLKLGVGLTALSAAALLAGGGALSMVAKWAAAKAAMDAAGISSARLATSLKGVGTAAAIAGAAFTIKDMSPGMWGREAKAVDEATRSLSAYIAKGVDANGVTYSMKTGFSDLGGAVDRVFSGNVSTKLSNFFGEVGNFGGLFGLLSSSQATESINFFKEMDNALAGLAGSGKSAEAAAQFKKITDEAARQGIAIEKVQDAFPAYAAALASATTSTDSSAASLAKQKDAADAAAASARGITKDQYQQAESAQAAKDATDRLVTAMMSLDGGALAVRASQRNYAEAVRDAMKAAKEKTSADKTAVEVEAEKQAALDGVAEATKRLLGENVKTGASEKTVLDIVARGREDYIKAAMAIDTSKRSMVEKRKAAEKLADGLKLTKEDVLKLIAAEGGLKPNINQTINLNSTEAMTKLRTMVAQMNLLQDKTVNIRYTTSGSINGSRSLAGGITADENGGIHRVQHFANGGMSAAGRPVRREPQVGSKSNRWIVWNEPQTHDEAYVSRKPGQESRNKSVLEHAASWFGMAVVPKDSLTPFANGGLISKFVSYALAQKGDRYVWGAGHQKGAWKAKDLDEYDCSGLVSVALSKAVGREITGTSASFASSLKKIGVSQAINTYGALLQKPGHIAISLGNGKTIEAMSKNRGVTIGSAKGRFTKGLWAPQLGNISGASGLGDPGSSGTGTGPVPIGTTVSNLAKSSRDTERFVRNVKALAGAGYTDLAQSLFSRGAESAGAEAAQLVELGKKGITSANAQYLRNARAATAVEEARKALTDQVAGATLIKSTLSSNKVTAAFLANVKAISKMGYPQVAASILEAGEDTMGPVAAQLAKDSTGKLVRQYRDATGASSALTKEAEALLAKLNGTDTVAGPTVIEVKVGGGVIGDPTVSWSSPRMPSFSPSPLAGMALTSAPGGAVRDAPLMHVDAIYASSPQRAITDMTVRLGDALAVTGIGRL